MVRRVARAMAAVLAVSALTVPAAAHAEKVVVEDPVRDVKAWTYDQDFHVVPAPEEASIDIARTVVAFGERRLVVTVELRDLRTRPRHDVLARVRTQSSTFDVIAARQSGGRPTIELTTPRDETLSCRGLAVAYDGEADVVRLSVPTTCLGSPRWVRVGVKATASPAAVPNSQTMVVFFVDDARRDGRADRTIALGPRIRRG